MVELRTYGPAIGKTSIRRPTAIADLCRRHGIRELSIFGSVLREDFRAESDVDVLIDLESGFEMSIELYMAIEDDLRALFRREIDLVEKPLVKNPYRRYEIMRTREVLYAA